MPTMRPRYELGTADARLHPQQLASAQKMATKLVSGAKSSDSGAAKPDLDRVAG